MLRKTAIMVMVAAVALLVSGCQRQPAYVKYDDVTPKYANLVTQDVTITTTDGKWELKHMTPVNPPKVRPVWRDNRGGGYGGCIMKQSFKPDFYENASLAEDMLDVRVKVDGHDKEFYGKMIFFNVDDRTPETSAKRLWKVEVPQQYIDIAKTGQVAVVYQPYRYIYYGQDCVSWALWFSELPL